MALLERILRYDYAVYWAPRGRTQFGKVLYENPVEVSCRWEPGIVARRDADGTEHVYNATVFVDRDVDIDGRLWHGRLVNVPVDGDPSVPPDDSELILRFDKVPTIRNNKFLRRVSV